MELAGFSVFRARQRTRENKAEGMGEEGEEGSRRGEIYQIQIPLIR